MDQIPIHDSIQILRSPALRVRTALWLLPLKMIGQERGEAIRYRLEAIDMRDEWLAHLPADTRFSGLSSSKLCERLDDISQRTGMWDTVLAFQFDLLLARLKLAERAIIWDYVLFQMARRLRGIIIAMPETAKDLLPAQSVQDRLNREQRLLLNQL